MTPNDALKRPESPNVAGRLFVTDRSLTFQPDEKDASAGALLAQIPLTDTTDITQAVDRLSIRHRGVKGMHSTDKRWCASVGRRGLMDDEHHQSFAMLIL